MHVVTLILAAGTSSRMGRVKQLLSIHEKTLLQHTVDLSMKIKSTKTLCVLGAHANEIIHKVDFKSVEYILNQTCKVYLAISLKSFFIKGAYHTKK